MLLKNLKAECLTAKEIFYTMCNEVQRNWSFQLNHSGSTITFSFNLNVLIAQGHSRSCWVPQNKTFGDNKQLPLMAIFRVNRVLICLVFVHGLDVLGVTQPTVSDSVQAHYTDPNHWPDLIHSSSMTRQDIALQRQYHKENFCG